CEYESSFGRFASDIGLRYDRFDRQQRSSIDPRAAMRIDTSAGRFRAGWGVYHQSLNAMYLDQEWGNPLLRPMRAEHRVMGYETGEPNGAVFLRLEAYGKRYSDLPLEDRLSKFSDRGYGTARGVDTFVKFAGRGWDGWFSGSYLFARRLFTPITD